MLQTEIHDFSLWINGQPVKTMETRNVLNKYTQEPIATIAVATKEHVFQAVKAGKKALDSDFPPYKRYQVIMKAADLLQQKRDTFAETLAKEVGKPLKECYGEVDRSIQTLILSAEEAKRIHGEGVPVEAAVGSENRMAFTIKVPVGVIAAITPFNVPLNLVCHKIGPGLAAGNSVVLKPAEKTPMVALLLTELFKQAGLPSGRLNTLTGSGREIGNWLLENKDVAMFTFTGSQPVGEYLRARAGIRKVSLELGNNSATLVHKDSDLEKAANLVTARGFNNAGQVCISVQRVYVHEEVKETFLSLVKQKTEALRIGDPFDEQTDIGPMIDIQEAQRVEEWVNEAVNEGANLITGGVREGALFTPTVLEKVEPAMKVSCEEVFGPVIAISSYTEIDEVLDRINDSKYGLQAGVFTNDLNLAMKAARKIEVGGVIINDTSAYRVDQMPYGGVKDSGNGKEGPAYAIEEMTEERLIVLNL
ncbi:aldehyde dehydrogenase family protein [Thalassobacillus pellis]|uniref:aldehyde dehydrogenase family protein n=1 Tax=Thalassobacillus pellis TaxID=748008 RepID=UPI001961A398|nr:aldehyde dehydrogenase family protein [Thalassobacillus pellis]MBM7554451.1 acyl-CoA reductase-like NAD-dependent aldehyde dehydrogenase [Thalassobacillus pellis]